MMSALANALSWLGMTAKDVRRGLYAPRSFHWPAVRRAHLKLEPLCAACGSALQLEVHHIIPFHVRPEMELVDSNLITLCEGVRRCHFEIGHFGNWSRSNPNVRRDAAARLLIWTEA